MVSENKLEKIAIFDARKLPVKIGLIAAIICALAFGWFAVRWQIGDMLAELTQPNDPNANEIAGIAVNLAPHDPLTNWLAASTQKDVFTPEAIAASVAGFEQVVKLAPHNYRWWLELGRAQEQAENAIEAEKAYRRAVELAPAYIKPRWQIGNFYLRQGRGDEAFAELKIAAQDNSVYRDQVFSIAWDFYDHDFNRLEQIAGDDPAVKAGLARFYASKELAADSLRVWNSMAVEDRRANQEFGKVIAQAFYEKRFFRQALEFVRELGIDPDAQQETVANGGFEKAVSGDKYFGWQITPIDKMEVKLDPTKKQEGARSLRVSFNGFAEPTLFNVNQYVTVAPSANYRLTFWLRTENLKSGGMPTLEIYDANSGKGIKIADAFPDGTTDWQQIKLDFSTPAAIEAVGIRTTRIFCGANCPIFGTLWYDDFKLEKLK